MKDHLIDSLILFILINIPCFFFIGESRNEEINRMVAEENRKYNDMIIFNYISSYYNNSLQFIMSMRWIYNNCKSFRYILSQQSDTFVNIPHFKNKYEFSSSNYSIISIIRKKEKVIRNKKSIWYIPYSIYNKSNIWPDFPYIPHLFLHSSTVEKIVNASYYLNEILFMDDVYLGMLLEFSNLNITAIKINAKFILHFNYRSADVDIIKNNILFMHGIKPEVVLYLSKQIFK